MHLIVEKLALFLRACLVRELSTAHRISNCDLSSSEQVEGTAHDDGQTCLTHDLVQHAWIRLEFEVTLFSDLCKPLEHRVPRYLDVSEHEVPIVNTIVAELASNITHLHSRKGLMCLPVSDLENERLHAIVVFKRDAAAEHHTVVGLQAEGSGPEFSRLDSR